MANSCTLVRFTYEYADRVCVKPEVGDLFRCTVTFIQLISFWIVSVR
jgi:hypothetical protein